MEDAAEVQDRINLVLSKKETIRRARDLVHHLGNEIQQWKDQYDQFDSIAEDLSERLRAVVARENATAERIRVVELKETEQLKIERNSRAKEKELEFLESRLDFCKRDVVEKEKELESCEIKCRQKEKELLSLCEAVKECNLKTKEKEKELLLLHQRVEESKRDLRREDEKLGFLMNTIDSRDEEISKKEEKLGLIDKKILNREMHCRRKEEDLISMRVVAEKLDSEIKEKEKGLHSMRIAVEKRDSEIKGKEKELQSLQNSLSGLHATYVSKKEVMEAQHVFDVALKKKELDTLQLKIDARSKELSILENSVADCSKRLDSKRIELDLINKRGAESIERERQSHQQQDSYPTGSATSSSGTQIKIEPSEFPTHGHIFPQYTAAATNYQFPILDKRIQSQMIHGELARLNIDTVTDLAKLTLADMDASYGQHLIRQEKGFDAEKLKEHINLLERIATSSTPITPEVKQRAMVLANKWVVKLRTPSVVDHLEALGFFNFLAAYKLASEFSQSEILWFIQVYSLANKAPQLCENILRSGNVVPSPSNLLQQKGNKKRPSDSELLDEQGT